MPASTLLTYFRSKHLEIIGYPYDTLWGKDTKLMKDLFVTYPLADIVKLIDLFFIQVKKDPFLQKTGASVGIFKTQIPKLLLSLSKETTNKDKGKW